MTIGTTQPGTLNQLQVGQVPVDAGTLANQQGLLSSNAKSNVLNNPAYGNLTQGPNGSYVGTVNPNELTSSQLSSLMSSSSPLEQLAAAQGAQQAAATGNANGTLMAGASQTALDNMLTPIAAQNAQVYERSAQANEAALNTAANVQTQASAQMASAGIYANAGITEANINQATQEKAQALQQQEFAASQSQQLGEFNTNWSNTMAQTKESQNWMQQDQATQNEFGLTAAAVNGAMNTVFSDPSYWNNPAGSLGMINDYSQNINQIVDSLFPQNSYGNTPGTLVNGVPNATANQMQPSQSASGTKPPPSAGYGGAPPVT